jgi:diacylglycerol kinase
MKYLLESFGCAFAGIAELVATEPNARIHFVATIVVVAAGFWLGISKVEWCFIVFAIAIVWVAEALNTAVEHLGDVASGGEHHPLVGRAKDVAAGGVLLAVIGATLIGVIILGPAVMDYLRR